MRRQKVSRQNNFRKWNKSKQHKRRLDKCGSKLIYQDLEPRQLLATTLYVDFGFGMATDFVVSDSDSSSLNGPAVFGSGYGLSSFADSVIADQIDANGDEISDASDAPLVADLIMENLSRIFLPFDIDIQWVESSSLADIAASLNATTTNDAYVFVGGSEPFAMFDHGAAVIDVGNVQDNLTFVFAEETYEQFGTPDIESPHNTTFAHARNIAKQAAHSFGLDSVESGNYSGNVNDLVSLDDPMAERGTNDQGEQFREVFPGSLQSYFTNQSMQLTHVNGVSTGSQNSFQLMEQAIGLDPNAPGYVAGDSQSNDVVVVKKTANTVDVTVDGTAFNDIDVTNGLWVEMGSSYGGRQSVNIAHDLTTEVNIFDGSEVIMDSGAVSAVFTGIYEGVLNGNINLSGTNTLTTGDFDDTILILDGGYLGQLNSHGGVDALTLPTGGQILSFDLGAGDDVFRSYGGTTGDDFVHLNIDGGSGRDTFDSSQNQVSGVNWQFTSISEDRFDQVYVCHPHDVYCFGSQWGGFERIIGSEHHSNQVKADMYNPDADLSWVIDGDVATISSGLFPVSAELIGFDEFFGQASELFDPFTGQPLPIGDYVDDFIVLETARDIRIGNAESLQISSDSDLLNGSTATINHDIHVDGYYDRISQVKISNRMGESPVYPVLGHEGDWNLLSGATGANVYFRGSAIYQLTVHGTDQFRDAMTVNANRFYVNFVGHGGDDLFFLGSNAAQANGKLDYIQGIIRYDGGDGFDRMHLNDQGAEARIDYQLDEKWISAFRENETKFSFVRIGDSVDAVQLQGSKFQNEFRVTPSPQTRFVINGNEADGQVSGDFLDLQYDAIGTAAHLFPFPTGGVWAFGDRKAIVHQGFERVGHLNFFSTSTQGGLLNSVQVREATNRKRIYSHKKINHGAETGVSTAMGDVNFDGVPDLVRASRGGLTSIVIVTDLRTGASLAEFEPYGNGYTDGVQVAVGNIFGDERPEIVTAKMDGRPQVRIFSQDDNGNYQFSSEFEPFASAFNRGATIAVADMNFDGYADVISGAGPGTLPQVAIHDVSQNHVAGKVVVQLNRFLVFGIGYRGGVNVAAGHYLGNPKPELLVGAGNVPSGSTFAGAVNVYRGERLPRNAPTFVLGHDVRLQAFTNTTAAVDLAVRDLNFDGTIDRLYVSNSTGSQQIKMYEVTDALNQFSVYSEQVEVGTGVGVG